MLSQKTIEIGGDTFILQQFPTTQALEFGVAVGKIVGSMMAGGLDGDGNLEGEGEFDFQTDMDVSGMIRGIMSALNDETPLLIKRMTMAAIASWSHDGESMPGMTETWYESRFAGALEDLVEILTVIVEDNFVAAILAAKKKAGANISAPSSAPSARANGSGQAMLEESPDSFFAP